MPTERIGDKSLSIQIEGLESLTKVFRKAGPEVNKKLQAANKALAFEVVEQAQRRVYPDVPGLNSTRKRPSNRGSIGRTKASIRANATARSASVVAGGPKAPGFFGHEFGGGARPRTRQFPVHRGRDGYFLYPAIRAAIPKTRERWEAIVDEVFEGEGISES